MDVLQKRGRCMENKDYKLMEISKWGRYLREKWLESFAGHLTSEEQKGIYMDSFLWHLCSYEKVICLEKQEALLAFNRRKKNKCTIFYQFINKAYLVQNAEQLKLKDLPYENGSWDYADMYIMDWENKWTFIITHENVSHDSLGPYFIEKS